MCQCVDLQWALNVDLNSLNGVTDCKEEKLDTQSIMSIKFQRKHEHNEWWFMF